MDNENIIYVDADTREAVLHSNFKIGVVNDDSCHTLTFRINKASDIDLTDLTFYVNTTSSRGNGDKLDCTKEEDGSYIFVKCLLKGTLFEAKGKATINLCGRKYDSNNTIIKKWGSEDITVLVGSHTDADKAIEERYPSVLEDLKSKIENMNITDEQLNVIATKVAAKGFYTKSEVDGLISKIVVPTKLSQLGDDTTHRLVSDAEKSKWNNKSDFNGSYNSLNDKPTIPSTLAEMTDDESHRVVTDSEKTTWNSKVDDKDIEPIKGEITYLRASLGLIDDVLGLTVDYKNKTCTRIAGAKNLTAGADFDKFSMYGGRKRCNVSDGGTINAYYGDEGYTEDGSNGQVMVYQPKFYYLVCPLEYDRQETGYGYHLRKANYYVSETQRAGFKLHPAFYDKNGNEVDYILMSAYEGCIYDTSANAYLKNDEQVMDASKDKFSSIAGARPASGVSQNLTRPNVEQMAKNRGEGWHSLGIKTASMEQLLMIVEMGMMNLQTAIGQGVVNLPWITGSDITSSYAGATGSTASLGNGTGRATKTTTYEGGKATDYTVDGKTSICYRGVENFWGNIWKFVYGVNIWGNGKMAGGMPYICSDFNYAEGKNTDNYEGAGFTVTKANGYISAMGYSTKYDWLFMASECLGNSSLPVGDYTYITENLNGYRIARLGGYWTNGSSAGGFSWYLNDGVGDRYRFVGARLVYVPH